MRFTASGAPVANFTVAVDRPFLNAQGQREADFIRVVAWRKLAENCSNYLGKGRLVAVEGRLQVRSYQTPEGQTRTVSEVVADNVQFLDRAREGTGPGAVPPEPDPMYPGGDFGDDDFGSEDPPF